MTRDLSVEPSRSRQVLPLRYRPAERTARRIQSRGIRPFPTRGDLRRKLSSIQPVGGVVPDRAGAAEFERTAGCPFRGHRHVIQGITYRYRCGIAWRDLPAEFGSWQTVWKRHRRSPPSGRGT